MIHSVTQGEKMNEQWQVEVILTKPDGSQIATRSFTEDPAELVPGIRENAEVVIRKWESEDKDLYDYYDDDTNVAVSGGPVARKSRPKLSP